MKPGLFPVAICIAIMNSVMHAQNTDHPYKFGFGTQVIDYNIEAESYIRDLVDTGDLQLSRGVTRYTFGRSLNKSFSIGAELSTASIDPDKSNNTAKRLFFFDAGLNLDYHFANDYILKQNCWFAPYITGGIALNYLEPTNEKMPSTYNEGRLGIGIDFWLSPIFGINIQSDYTAQFSDKGRDYAHHALGVVIRFGNGADADDDGISDWEDKCPDVSGIEKFEGCPDIDHDDIPDAEDACPSQHGSLAMHGCPDNDNDGIADKDDNCPTEKGSAKLNGCPDADNDGIIDKDDHCPQDKGSLALNGCPDTDNDGIADIDDACKNDKGLAAFHGCPDSDNDGIQDKEDRCPKDKGSIALKGCPDSDADGIADIDDHCPKMAGMPATDGCPEIDPNKKQEVTDTINFAVKSIEFESGKDILKKSSYASLDKIISIMKLYPYSKWTIAVYTDNQGDDKTNLVLTDNRATAIKNYLVEKGIAASRLNAVGYGESNPIGDNKTAAGRAKNRRVEINLVMER